MGNQTYNGYIYNKSGFDIVYVITSNQKIQADAKQQMKIEINYQGNLQLNNTKLQSSGKIAYQNCTKYKFEKVQTLVTVPNQRTSKQGLIALSKNETLYFSLFVGQILSNNCIEGYPLFLGVPIKSNQNILWKITSEKNQVVYKSISEEKAKELQRLHSGNQTTGLINGSN